MLIQSWFWRESCPPSQRKKLDTGLDLSAFYKAPIENRENDNEKTRSVNSHKFDNFIILLPGKFSNSIMTIKSHFSHLFITLQSLWQLSCENPIKSRTVVMKNSHWQTIKLPEKHKKRRENWQIAVTLISSMGTAIDCSIMQFFLVKVQIASNASCGKLNKLSH